MYGQDEYIGLDQDVLKTSSEDEDERRLQDVFKTSSSRRMFAGLYYICYIESAKQKFREDDVRVRITALHFTFYEVNQNFWK